MKMTTVEKWFVNSPSHTRGVAEHALQLLSLIDDYTRDGEYLDVGCGVGSAARKIADSSRLSVTGIDIDPKQIETAQNGAAIANLQFKVMDATKLEFENGKFDVVASHMATHHIPKWEQALFEMARVLRIGGYLIYTDFVFSPWLAKAVRLFRSVGFPSTRALDSIATKAGLVRVYRYYQSGRADIIWMKASSSEHHSHSVSQ